MNKISFCFGVFRFPNHCWFGARAGRSRQPGGKHCLFSKWK